MTSEKKLFFSIKWKALLLFGLLISASHAVQYGISYQQINDQFQRQHNHQLHYQHSIIEALIEQSARLMEQITELSDTPYNDNPSYTEDYIASSLEQQWDSLQANWGLTAILMYNTEGQAKKSWGSDSRELIQQNDLTAALQTAKPMHRLICADQCYQIVYIPTLLNPNSEQHALIVFVRSLADIIISFKETTRTDIAILRPVLNTKSTPGKQLNIVASTHTKQLKKLLKSASHHHSIDALLNNETSLQFMGGKQFSLRLFNLGEQGQPNSPYLLLATDLTNEYILINQSKKEAFYAILLALIASSLILLPFLLKVTQRIITVSNALPALSKGQYDQAKQYLQKTGKQSQKIQDEFDTLEKSTLLVIEQLDKGSQLIKEKEQNLVWLADHDSLTQLFNRRRFQVEFEHQLKLAERYKNSGAILYLDLDQFKYINDTSGHAAGDLLLKQVAETLQQVIRSSDTLARLGGDEFALMVPATDSHGASQLAKKVLSALQLIHFESNGHQHNITASIGIAMFPEYGLSLEDFMSNADIAMYQAKESGRGKEHLYSPEEKTKEMLERHVLWKEKIESALAEKRFILHFQPILDIQSNRISHAEALVRMVDKDGGLIMPNDFIPTAEKSGLINQVDLAVLDLTFETLRVLDRQNNPLSLSFNLSGKAFSNTPLITQLKEELNKDDIDATKLIIEVTETMAVANLRTAIKLMNEIKKTGAKFALDDFGVGYASFFYLRQLPVDYVKIDGSFIQQLDEQKEDQLFVKAIAEITKVSGKKTIAEFVENQAILDLLDEFDVDYAQGYHIAKPSAKLPSN